MTRPLPRGGQARQGRRVTTEVTRPRASHARPRRRGGRGAGGRDPGTGGRGPGTARAEQVDVGRSSRVMALGTLASRGTGFLRTLVMAAALGTVALSNDYNTANTLPNVIHDLVIGGILTSAVVPLLVGAAKRDRDRGRAYEQRMFTLTVLVLLALTVVATACSSLLIDLYAPLASPVDHHLMVIFAYFFIPQIFFYGVSSLAGGVLNARGSFAAPMWTPVINNIVMIAVLLLFIAVGGLSVRPSTITGGQVQLLGLGTTLGIVVQTLALIPALRAAGFRWRPRFDFVREEMAEIRRMAGPLSGYIVTTQLSLLVVVNVATAASRHHPADGIGTYTYAFTLFQMPYAVVGISVITALLPRMSAHAAARRYAEVRRDFSGGVRLSSVIVVPAALILGALGAPLAEAVLAYGRTTPADAHYIGTVFGIFCFGLLPYVVFQLMLRVFYALHDSRTPMFVGIAVMLASIAVSLASLALLPGGQVMTGVAAAFGVGNVVGVIVAWPILSRRLRGLGGRRITRSLVRMHMAAVPGMIFALATGFVVSVFAVPGPAFGIATVIIGGGGGMVLYLLFARALGITEVADLVAGLRRR